jgi:hypothetical protein
MSTSPQREIRPMRSISPDALAPQREAEIGADARRTSIAARNASAVSLPTPPMVISRRISSRMELDCGSPWQRVASITPLSGVLRQNGNAGHLHVTR